MNAVESSIDRVTGFLDFMGKFNYRWHSARLKIPMDEGPPPVGWVTVAEAASILGVSVATVRKRYLKGSLKCSKFENSRLIYVKIIG